MKRFIDNKKELACFCIVVISVLMIGILCGILASESRANVDKQVKKQQISDTSTLIRYNNSNYQVVPVDMLQNERYAKVLDKLGCGYEIKSEYIGDLLTEIEGGAFLYKLAPTKKELNDKETNNKERNCDKEEVLILKDYNGEYNYVFKF